MRSGIIAKKIGMTRLFMEDGKQIPVTVLATRKPAGRDPAYHRKGRLYRCSAWRRHSKGKAREQAMRGHFAAKVEPKRKLVEFRVSCGQPDRRWRRELSAEHFLEGQKVDVCRHIYR